MAYDFKIFTYYPKTIVSKTFMVLFAILMIVSMAKIYKKAGQPFWGAFVPFYNLFVFSEMVFGIGWLFVLEFLPYYLGYIFGLVSFFMLGKKFNTSGILTMIFPFIMLPIIAFNNKYQYKN